MRLERAHRAVVLAAVSAFLCGAARAQVPEPAAHLGRPLGADFELADWDEVAGYHRALAAASPRVQVETVGSTTEGRDFLLSVVSSEANLARLEELRAHAARLADPRGSTPEELERAVRDGRVFLFVSLGMHSTETAAPQFGMEFVHRLATSDAEPYRSAREELVVLVAPCLNPDGLDQVVEWYRRTVGTPHEGAGLLELYQRYAGHDNNRDWFMLTQVETRLVTRLLYGVWHPQVYWDVHQQGQSRERIFVPPFRDPLNPNLDPGLIAGIGVLGSRALYDMTREGLTGVSTGVSYDMWWNGGNRNVPVRHNVIGLLTEAASVDLASPVFLPLERLSAPHGIDGYEPSNRFPAPWPGGWWRLRDVIEYEHAFARSLLGSLARERERWLTGALQAALRAVERGRDEAPRAWLFPSDGPNASGVRRLVDALLLSGVEVAVAESALDLDGRAWPAGSIVVRRDQPYGAHAKDLLEVQRYPEGPPPYDVAGWTLPLLFGVHRVEVMGPVEGPLRPVASAEEAVAAFAGSPAGAGLLAARESDTWRAVIARLAAGEPVTWIPAGDDAGCFALGADVHEGAREGARTLHRLPRVGLYAPWSGSMDEGWTRWLLDDRGLSYERVRNEMLRAGDLGRFLDVLVLPDLTSSQLDRGRRPGSVPSEYVGGLDPEGAVAVEEFVREGGTLVALGRAGGWARELLQLELEDAADDEGFSCPGSVLRAIPTDDPRAAGLPSSVAVFVSRSSAAWDVPDDAEGVDVLLRYAPTRLLLSGWIEGGDAIAGKAAWLRAEHGRGAAHLFGFSPQYRGWSEGTFELLFRAVLLEERAP